jgi:DNA-binding Lrp family transcriptional regulator
MSLDQHSTSVVEAYSDPLQRRILFALDGDAASARELAARFDTPATVVVELLEQLEARGLIERATAERLGDRADETYRTRIPIELDDAEWAELPVATRQRLVDAITTEIIHGLATSTEAGLSTADDTHVSRLVLTLDAAGRARVNTMLAALIEQCVAEQRASDARADRTTAPRRSMLAVLNVDLAVPGTPPVLPGR